MAKPSNGPQGWGLGSACAHAGLAVLLLAGLRAHAADLLERTHAADERAADGLVHCLFPGQVRRLGAFSTSMTPRRAARVAPKVCADAGGEYIELQDVAMAATKVWLPMAAEGVPEAQATVGELYERQGKAALAKSWYEKAAAQGSARASFNLAAILAQGLATTASVAGKAVGVAATAAGGTATAMSSAATITSASAGVTSTTANAANAAADRIGELLVAASGGLINGLAFMPRDPPRVDFVSPSTAEPLPHVLADRTIVESDPGPAVVVARVVAAAGLASVKVNGQDQTPDAQGFLNIPVTVGSARTNVTVQAQDQSGQMAQADMALIQRSPAPSAASAAAAAPASVSTSASATAPSANVVAVATPPVPMTPAATAALLTGRRLALVVANQAYAHWPKLETPIADAKAVSAALRQHFGYDVTEVVNATRQQLLAALNKLRTQAGPEDQVLVYYAGHGQMDPVTARGYWIPVDGDEKDLAQWVSVIDVTDQLAAMSARHVMVIADSCYAGTLTRSLIPQVDQALTLAQRQAPLAYLAKQRVRVALTSGGLEPVVDGGSVDHSLFARSLLDMLEQVKAPVAAQEFFAALSSRFAHLAQRLQVAQQPQYAPIGFAGHEAGDFVLVPL